MDIVLAEAMLICAALYGLAGLVFALAFITLFLKRFDPNAGEAAPLQFRILIFPGVVALWPLLLALMLKRSVLGGAT